MPKPEDKKPEVPLTEDGRPVLCDVSKCSKVKIAKGDRIKTLYVAPNMKSDLLKFAADEGPELALVVGCADGWKHLGCE